MTEIPRRKAVGRSRATKISIHIEGLEADPSGNYAYLKLVNGYDGTKTATYLSPVEIDDIITALTYYKKVAEERAQKRS